MPVRAIFLSHVLALLLSLAGVSAPLPRVLEVLKQFDRTSSRPLWPRFEPRRIPLQVFDGGRTWLQRVRARRPSSVLSPEKKTLPYSENDTRACEPIPRSAADEDAARRRAADDAVALKARNAALLREFLRAPGWTVVVETEDPIFPLGFDPWNVERLSASEVLHTRWIKLGNSSGWIEVLDRHCLTEGAGKHPLFEGVARATITGLPSEPRIEEADGAVKIFENGLTLDFRGARVAQDGQTVTITLRPQRGVPRADPSLRSG